MYNIFMYIYDIYFLDNKSNDNIDLSIIDNRNLLERFNKEKYDHNIHYKYYKFFTLNIYNEIFKLIGDSIKNYSKYIPPFKLLISDINNPNNKNYGIHRYGWKKVIYNFLETTYNEYDPFHYENPSFEWLGYAKKYNLNTYLEAVDHFILNKDESCSNFKYIFFDPWLELSNYKNIDFSKMKLISFIHDPPIYENKYKNTKNKIINIKINNDFFCSKKFLKLKDHIKILCTLTNTHKEYLENNNVLSKNITIKSLLHPLEGNRENNFNINEYLNNKNKKIYFIGWWLRKFDIFYKINNKKYQKIILVKNTEGRWVTEYIYFEIRKVLINEDYAIKSSSVNSLTIDEINILKSKNVHISNFISNNEYDLIFRNNIVFLDFYSTSANNALLECIYNNTPVLVKKNAACVEYLGEKYPLYFDSLEEVEYKLNNTALIIAAHNYLKKMPKEQFTYKYFNEQLKNIIVKNL